MFKIESYITPYVLSYLDKYFTNFNPSNFQVSLWSGAASFNDLDLNLEVLEQEFDLPVKLLSGHIHQLQICIPWTKITYEPIVVYVNTIEITMRLKKEADYRESRENAEKKGRHTMAKESEEPPGYVQGLINKIVMNMRIDCQNVILKVVEEDIVFSLNVKNATQYSTDDGWLPSFVDLATNEYILRREIAFSDLTICLDKMNSSGKIEQYMEPLLYKCSFGVRVFQQYSSQLNGKVHNTVIDVLCDELVFTVTDEQIPMLIRLYMETMDTNECHRKAKTAEFHRRISNQPCDSSEEKELFEDNYGLSWGAWGMGLVTSAAEVLVGGFDPENEDQEQEITSTTAKIGIYANRAVIIVKGMEAAVEQKRPRGIPRLTFQPFLKISLQGIVMEMSQKHNDYHTFMGLSYILVEGVQTCPCGIQDCFPVETSPSIFDYLRVGERNPNFASYCLFEKGPVVPVANELFNISNRAEFLTEEMMLKKSHAVAIEYLDVRQSHGESESAIATEPSSTEINEWSFSKVLCRFVVAPCTVKICSGSIHRFKMIMFAASASQKVNMEPSEESRSEAPPMSRTNPHLMEVPLDVIQFTVIRPTIEIIAGDHLEFNERTHIRGRQKKRKAVTVSPLSQILKDWPSLKFSCDCVDSHLVYPSRGFLRMLQIHHNADANMTSLKQTWNIKAQGLQTSMRSHETIFQLITPFNMNLKFVTPISFFHLNTAKLGMTSTAGITVDGFRINFAKPHLMISRIIFWSCFDLNVSHFLTSTTLLEDFMNYRDSLAVLHLADLSYEAAFTNRTHSVRFRIGSVGFFVNLPGQSECFVIFESVAGLEPTDNGFFVATMQIPVRIHQGSADESHPREKFEKIPAISVSVAEYICKVGLQQLEWIRYLPQEQSDCIPDSAKANNLYVHPMIPVTRASSRMSLITRALSYSDADFNESMSGQDLQRLYDNETLSSMSSSVSSSAKNLTSGNDTNVQKMSIQSLCDNKLGSSVSDFWYILMESRYNSFKWIVFMSVSSGTLYFYNSSNSTRSSTKDGIACRTPKIAAQPQSARSELCQAFHISEFPIRLLNELKEENLYPFRIVLEDSSFSTFNSRHQLIKLCQPLNAVLTFTVAEKQPDDQTNKITSIFIHADVTRGLLFAWHFSQLTTTVSTVSIIQDCLDLIYAASNLNATCESNHERINEQKMSECGSNKTSKRRIDAAALSKGSFPQQHSTTSSIPEIDPNESEVVEEISALPKDGSNFFHKRSIWFQLTISQIQFSLIDDTVQDVTKGVRRLVYELNDITASLDAQEVFQKLSLKISGSRLRHFVSTSGNLWDLGDCDGIIFTSGDDITHAINHITGPRKRLNSFEESANRNHSPLGFRRSSFQPNESPPVSGSSSHGFLALTFTRVQAKNFHKKSDLYSPSTRWNMCLKKFMEKYDILSYVPYADEDLRYLSELDVNCGALDLLIDIALVQHYLVFCVTEVRRLETRRRSHAGPATQGPAFSNATLPLVYFKSGPCRIFMRSSNRSGIHNFPHDTVVLETSCLKIDSQSENPSNRTVVEKTLYKLAEQIGILDVPGSPVEDRQYQLDFMQVKIYTLSWEALMLNSKELKPARKTILKTMGENPALEWNTVEMESVPSVIAYPILESIDLSFSLAPPIVYQASLSELNNTLIVAGSSVELNVTVEANIYVNLDQIRCIKGIMDHLSTVGIELNCGKSDTSNKNPMQNKESDSGIGSVVPTAVKRAGTQNAQETLSSWLFVPVDLLVAGFMIQVIVYDFHERRVEDTTEVSHLVPLLMLLIGQPHLVLSLSSSAQRLEFSIFDLSIGMSAEEKRLTKQFHLPDINDFSNRLFNNIYGERNSKTGMVNPFMTLRCYNFICPQGGDLGIDISRPTEIDLDRAIIRMCLKTITYFETIKRPNPDLTEEQMRLMEKDEAERTVVPSDAVSAIFYMPVFSYFRTINAKSSQLIVKFSETGKNGAPDCAIAFGINSSSVIAVTSRTNPGTLRMDAVHADFRVDGLTVTSAIESRRDILLYPWKFNLNIKLQSVYPSLPPSICLMGTADTCSIHVGPQTLLALAQLYRVFGCYLNELLAQQDAIDLVMHEGPCTSRVPVEEFEDDLRSGNFRYIHLNTAEELPGAYQIAFYEINKSMTWCYPHKRCLTRMESFPVPFESSSPATTRDLREVPCVVEYFDEVLNRFCHFGVLYLSEHSKGSLQIPEKSSYHLYMASIWRVVISDAFHNTAAIKPEILAASLRIDSIQDVSLNPRLKCHVELGKVRVNLVNQLNYGNEVAAQSVQFYARGGPTLSEHPFLSMEFSNTSLLVILWASKCDVKLNSYYRVSVTQYGHLTETIMVDPLHFEANFSLEQYPDSGTTRSRLDLVSKPVELKVSSSILHSLTVSLMSWEHILSYFNGAFVDFTDDSSKWRPILSEIVVCNDLHSDILINQLPFGGENNPVQAVTCESVGCRECFAFVWPTNKASTRCKISVRDPEWKTSDSLVLTNGFQVIGIQKSKYKLFVHVKRLSSSQKLASILGPFSIANACTEAIEVAILPSGGGREITYVVQGGTHGPSRLLNIEDLEHFRFRYTSDVHVLPWSPVISVKDLLQKKRIPVIFFRQTEKGSIIPVSAWGCLLREEIGGALRHVVVIAPAFRIKSSLTQMTTVFSSVGRVLPDDQFELDGCGAEKQVEFGGNIDDTVRYLTFQCRSSASTSTPPIPLRAEEITDEDRHVGYIQDILDNVYQKIHEPKNHETSDTGWPYISNGDYVQRWLPCVQPETAVEVDFSPWVKGLPTVLVDLKPWALFVNLVGQTLYFADDLTSQEFEIPCPSVFTPAKIGGKFRVGYKRDDNIFWSIPLELSDDQSRLEIHEANYNGKLPVDGISVLQIEGMKEVCFLTIEAKMRKSVLIITVRPTFLVRNETCKTLNVKGISLRLKKVQNAAEWNTIDGHSVIESQGKALANPGATQVGFTALPTHYCDMSRASMQTSEENTQMESASYLALSCGGPWWFVQLCRFDLLFNYLSMPEGVQGRRIPVVLPMFSPVQNRQLLNFSERLGIPDSSLPLVVNWTARNGQVWINFTEDTHPQLVIHNMCNLPLFFAQASNVPKVPVPDTENFDQYSYVAMQTRGFFSFPKSLSDFLTEQRSSDRLLPSLIVAKPPERPSKVPKSITDSLGYFSEHNLLYSGVFDWSKPIRIDGSTTSVQVVNNIGIKITIEHIGFTKVLYIENLSTVEVLAKDIRLRIKRSVDEDESTSSDSKVMGDKDMISIQQDSKSSVKSSVGVMTSNVCPKSLEVMVYFPWLRLVLLSDVNVDGCQYEVLSTTVQDFLIQRYSRAEHEKLRCIGNRELVSHCMNISLGDIQIDAPPFEEKRFDFAVILKQESSYTPIFASPNEGFNLRASLPLTLPTQNAVTVELVSEQTSVCEFGLSSVKVKVQPLNVFLEKHFIQNILPVLDRVLLILEERSAKILEITRLPIAGIATAPWPIPCDSTCTSCPLEKASLPTVQSFHEDLAAVRVEVYLNKGLLKVDVPQESQPNDEDGHAAEDANRAPIAKQDNSDDQEELSALNQLSDVQFPVSESYASQLHCIPPEIQSMLAEFSYPLFLRELNISHIKIYASVRLKYGVYLAFDHAPLDFHQFRRGDVITTYYRIGHDVGQHYWQNVLFSYKNLVSGVGSWEGVGSPTRLVGEVTTGLRDLVVMPYEGIFRGPSGFFVGIGKGCSSMLKHITAGTINSVTNGAWTWSRNLDALTQDDEDRRADIHGITDGVAQGFASLGVRMLGAIGGIAHYPIQAVINNGASPSSIVSGVARGVASVVTRPVGGALELLAMTGEGILKGTGWSQHNKTKFQPLVEMISSANYAILKYQHRLISDEVDEKIILVVDASQKSTGDTENVEAYFPVALILSDVNLYVYSCGSDELVVQVPLQIVRLCSEIEDKNLLCLKMKAVSRQREQNYYEDRVREFVLGTSVAETQHSSSCQSSGVSTQGKLSTNSMSFTTQEDVIGSFYLDSLSKEEFVACLQWLQKIAAGELFQAK